MSVEAPLSLAHMRATRLGLRYLGAWPHAHAPSRAPPRAPLLRHPLLLLPLWASLTALQILYLWNNFKNLSLFDSGHIIFFSLVFVVILQRTTMATMQSYRTLSHQFLSEIHLIHHRHKSEYAMKVYKQVNKICLFLFWLNSIPVVTNPTLVSLMPINHNYRDGMFSSPRPHNGTFELSIYYQLPFDYETNLLGYVVVIISNHFIQFEAIMYWCCYDLYLSLMLFHTWGHLKILDHNLRNFPRPGVSAQEGSTSTKNPPWYTQIESTEIAALLKDYIDHHRMLMKFVRKTSDAFGLMVFVCYGFHQVCDCILLHESLSMDVAAIEFGFMTFFSIVQMIKISIVFEAINMKSETLADAVYSVPWECMRSRERRTLLIFLSNVQTPMSLKALGLVPVGVRTMATIIKTSLSYFMLRAPLTVSSKL